MRNTSKLKLILQVYTITLDIDEDELLYLTLIHKQHGTAETFINKSYSTVIAKAYSYMMKALKQK